ncbi:single-strand binding family protein [synthetic Mycoplasma mycoides JCVI-syn1.0]|uniref:Single-stranded DNA-binding protein n=1 Tax=Mycoplasma mycoides subsp. capri TaxID=40477 RepID=A0AB38GF45_MYCMC|nr:single-stranded DNA-binding protein [Mycoplasma mycoides]ADH21588.1 single-strand binding family protein [synthetic Mycoplasma mycoides JCVI-syn1.0]ACU78943.1 single-strand binding family protein [Mycoplasma mycoides subsp. capri str. GM12]ACU79774.1 single-strand binding family protein [Mycoplasma mycoides subsp. capri str. GM12]SRX61687.1 single-stranded DNA-binding protein [Mycoplasma mycoides subsp. capri]SRX63273.1 single-stranded DNA-binding protein [Mycoplasma mycoides subsp. capri]
MNQVNLIGRLANEKFYEKDYQTENKRDGKLLKFQIATLKTPKTEFLEITVYNKLAELIKKYVHKGDLIQITGKLQNNIFKTKDNKTVSKTEIIGDSILFLTNSNKTTDETNQQVFDEVSDEEMEEFMRDLENDNFEFI